MFEKMQLILKDIVDYIESEGYSDIVLIALNETKAAMQNRIFNSESGAKDTKGQSIPRNAQSGKAYSVSWGNVRRAYGRQIEKKDYSFHGSLFKSIQVLREGEKYVVKLGESVKARNIERYEKREIFEFSEEEVSMFYTIFNELLTQEIKRIVDKHR